MIQRFSKQRPSDLVIQRLARGRELASVVALCLVFTLNLTITYASIPRVLTMIKTYATLAASCAALLVTVSALPAYVKLIPNGGNVNGIKALGHADGVGASDELDAFGKAFAKAGDKWTTALCKADSDGDGRTNGEELGDPCCEWTPGSTPKFSGGVSNPGDPAVKVAASVLAANSCSASTSDVAANPTNTTEGQSKSSSSASSATPTPTTTSAAAAVFPVITASALLGIAAMLQ